MAAGWAMEGFTDLYAAVQAGLGELTVGLYRSGPAPVTPVDPVNYGVSTWNGYQAEPLGPYPVAVIDDTIPQAMWTWPAVTWTSLTISSPEAVMGWYVEDAKGNWLVVHDISPPLQITTPGQVVSLTLTLEINGGTLGARAALKPLEGS